MWQAASGTSDSALPRTRATQHAAPRSSRGATLVLRLRKHMACTPFSPEEGLPGLVIPNPDFLQLTANQEVMDIFYKTRISFLNQTIGRYLNPNSRFYEPHRNYPNERRQDKGYLSRDQPHFNGRRIPSCTPNISWLCKTLRLGKTG